jgi:ABC-type transport system involved in multi-copper enzyme maturation permease subunit
MNKTNPRTFSRLLLWEIEGCLNLLTLLLIVASAIVAVLIQSSIPRSLSNSYINLYDGTSTIFLILTLVTCTLFSHSFAGSLEKGELKRMLSYPVKRWQVFTSKIIALTLIVFGVYASAFTLNLYLSSLSPLEPMFYISIVIIFLQLLLVCAVSVGISIALRSELISILASFLLLFGLDMAFNYRSYLSSNGRFTYIFSYFQQVFHPNFSYPILEPPATAQQALISIATPLFVAAIVMIGVFVYFTRKMEVD